MKNTPSLIDAEDPVFVESETIHLAKVLLASIEVDAYVISDKVIKFSPFWNTLVDPSEPELLYFT